MWPSSIAVRQGEILVMTQQRGGAEQTAQSRVSALQVQGLSLIPRTSTKRQVWRDVSVFPELARWILGAHCQPPER